MTKSTSPAGSGELPRPDLVIFDCDGVLVDSERLSVVVESRLLTDLGWPLTPAEVVERFLGRTEAAMLDDIEAQLGPEARHGFEARYGPETEAAFRRELTAVPGVHNLLDALDGTGVRHCVASSGTFAKMHITLGLTGLLDRFRDRIFSASQVARGKPAPDLFEFAATRMGVAPARCVVIEDSPHGIQAAVAAGMPAIGYASELVSPEVLTDAGATAVVDDMAAVPALLGVGTTA